MLSHSIKIDVAGPLEVRHRDGRDLTPSSKKGKGLIAILCTAPSLKCSRVKLQDILWSDRQREQGSNSLRQALTGLRRDLNRDEELLISNGDWVGLNPERVQVCQEISVERTSQPLPEFAEGLYVNDPEFEDWIREQRSFFEAKWRDKLDASTGTSLSALSSGHQLAGKTPTQIVIAGLPIADSELKFGAEMILRDAAKRACSFGDFLIVDEGEPLPSGVSALRISCLANQFGDRVALYPILMVERSRRTIWSQSYECDTSQLLEVLTEISDALTLAILKSGNAILDNEVMNQDLPLTDIFGYSREGLISADTSLEAIDGGRKVPALLALRAYIRHTMIMERVTDRPDNSLAEADEMICKALESAPLDSFALAVRSLVNGLNDQEELALDYAKRAVQSDTRNAFARQALSVALSFAGFFDEANEQALIARGSRLSVISPAIYFQRCSYTALGVGNELEALSYAKMAHGSAPNFRPALRVIAALSFRQKDEVSAVQYLQLLRNYEPDFTLDLLTCPDYPAHSLRRANAIDIANSRLI